MTVHRERRILPFTPAQIFDLVADVERYPDFLPLWQAVATHRCSDDPELYLTEQTLQLGPVRKTFRTETRMQRPALIRITSKDPLFDEFCIQWLLESRSARSCLVCFSLCCEASSPLLRPVFEIALGRAAQGTVKAFERRAHALYGG